MRMGRHPLRHNAFSRSAGSRPPRMRSFPPLVLRLQLNAPALMKMPSPQDALKDESLIPHFIAYIKASFALKDLRGKPVSEAQAAHGLKVGSQYEAALKSLIGELKKRYEGVAPNFISEVTALLIKQYGEDYFRS